MGGEDAAITSRFSRKLISILTLVFLSFFLVSNANAVDVTAQGSNFNIFFPSGSSLSFQHLPLTGQTTRNVIITLTVASGTLNGTNCGLALYPSGGILVFVSQNNASITLDSNFTAVFQVNGVSTNVTSIASNVGYRIEWSYNDYAGTIWFPIAPLLGLVGLGCMFAAPLNAINKWRKKEYRTALVQLVILGSIGFGLFVGWVLSGV